MMSSSLSRMIAQEESKTQSGQPLRFTLRKLPMWGEQVAEDVIDFEWPTVDMISDLPEDIKLKKLQFGSYWNNISSVTCILSNYLQSHTFQNFNTSLDKMLQYYDLEVKK